MVLCLWSYLLTLLFTWTLDFAEFNLFVILANMDLLIASLFILSLFKVLVWKAHKFESAVLSKSGWYFLTSFTAESMSYNPKEEEARIIFSSSWCTLAFSVSCEGSDAVSTVDLERIAWLELTRSNPGLTAHIYLFSFLYIVLLYSDSLGILRNCD